MAVTAFAELQELDPYRLENMDTYSNLLYIKVRIIFSVFHTEYLLMYCMFENFLVGFDFVCFREMSATT